MVADTTQRGAGGPSISKLFGLGVAQRSARASNFLVDPNLVADPTKVALGKLDLSVAAGQPAIAPGRRDGRAGACPGGTDQHPLQGGRQSLAT